MDICVAGYWLQYISDFRNEAAAAQSGTAGTGLCSYSGWGAWQYD